MIPFPIWYNNGGRFCFDTVRAGFFDLMDLFADD